MSLNIFNRKISVLSVFFMVSVLFSCKKDGKLSPDFDNGNLSIIYTDTFSLNTSVVQDVPGRTDVAIQHLLGVYNDPIFGMKSSSIYSNVGLAGASTDFGSLMVIDSLVLVLDPVAYYGNGSSTLTVNVYELSAPLNAATDYFSNTYTATETTLLGSAAYVPGTPNNLLRVSLTDPALIDSIANRGRFSDNADFNTVLKGLHIVTSDTATSPAPIPQGDGAITYFDLSSSLSGLFVYYHSNLGNYLQERFILNSDVESYSRFINDYTSTDVEKHLNNDASKNTSRTYVSTMKGVRTKIEIPNIKELAQEGPIAINKAEITFTLASGTDATPDNVLSSLALTGIDANGNAIVLLDDPTLEGIDHYGGTYNTATKSITYNITKHIHQLITTTGNDYGMYLTANGSVTSANRIVLNSENSAVSKIKLEITYSKI